MAGYIETFRAVVYPWHCDHQGHMTTMHYVGMFDAAFWHLLSAFGFTRSYLAEREAGFFDVRDVIDYKAEQPVGSLVMIESGIVRVGTTSVTGLHRMLNAETRQVAAVSERTSVFFDLKRREKRPIPDDMRGRMEAAAAVRP